MDTRRDTIQYGDLYEEYLQAYTECLETAKTSELLNMKLQKKREEILNKYYGKPQNIRV